MSSSAAGPGAAASSIVTALPEAERIDRPETSWRVEAMPAPSGRRFGRAPPPSIVRPTASPSGSR